MSETNEKRVISYNKEEMDAIDGQEVQFPVVSLLFFGKNQADTKASAKKWLA